MAHQPGKLGKIDVGEETVGIKIILKEMDKTEIKGKVITVDQPAYILYSGFSDMRNFVRNLPEDKREGVTATEDTIEGEVKGFRMGLQIAERNPFSSVVYTQYGQSPFPFRIKVFFEARDVTKTDFHIEVEAELTFMIKMMLGNKLQEAVDRLTDQLGLAFAGKISPADFDLNDITRYN